VYLPHDYRNGGERATAGELFTIPKNSDPAGHAVFAVFAAEIKSLPPQAG
jgi:hypothetical protein